MEEGYFQPAPRGCFRPNDHTMGKSRASCVPGASEAKSEEWVERERASWETVACTGALGCISRGQRDDPKLALPFVFTDSKVRAGTLFQALLPRAGWAQPLPPLLTPSCPHLAHLVGCGHPRGGGSPGRSWPLRKAAALAGGGQRRSPWKCRLPPRSRLDDG